MARSPAPSLTPCLPPSLTPLPSPRPLSLSSTALDELNADVDDTQTRMHTAMGVMKKMLKQKDRGKFCCILVLSVVLFVLVFLVLN